MAVPGPILQYAAEKMAESREVLEKINNSNTEIQQLFREGVVFITGCTGFIGKQLLEKLFRTNRSLKKAYVLLRPKKGRSMKERLTKLFEDTAFDEVKKLIPDFEERVIAVEGDVSDVKLGIQEQDWQILIDEVNFIFHAAATIRFNEPLKYTVLTNVRGTREVIHLAQHCSQLRSIVHVSTAYVHCYRRDIKEIFYDCPVAPSTLIEMVETVDEKTIDSMTPTILGDWPNSYTFTKAIAEEVVRTLGAGLPICITRPAVVIGAFNEPTPGWLDKNSVFGPSGFFIGLGLGGIHTYWADPEAKIDAVPVDFVNNLAIVASYETVRRHAVKNTDIMIYTLSGYRNHIFWGDLPTFFEKCMHWLSPKVLYYVYGCMVRQKSVFIVLSIFLHFIPGLIADGVLTLMGKKRRVVKLYRLLYNMNCLFSHFTTNNWNHYDDNTVQLYNNMSEADQMMFNYNMSNIDANDLIQRWTMGVRKFLLKDDLQGSELGVKKQFWFRIFHYVFSVVYAYTLWKILCLLYYFVTLILGYLGF